MEINELSLSELLEKIKQSKRKGICNYWGGCSENPIQSHLISKSYLNKIATNGEVVILKNDMFGYLNSKPVVNLDSISVHNALTFPGFCSDHDNAIFEMIDNQPFDDEKKYLSLFHYRSLIEQLTSRRQVLSYFPNLRFPSIPISEQEKLKKMCLGYYHGTHVLEQHQSIVVKHLKEDEFKSLNYILFIFEKIPSVLFSGVTYPDYDFEGNLVQDLSDLSKIYQLLSFFSIELPDDKHGIVFVWDNSSMSSCLTFMNSLITQINKEQNINDILFYFLISRCGNFTINPSWYYGLNDNKKSIIFKILNGIYDYPNWEHPNNLNKGINKIIDWEISDITVSINS